MRKLLVVFVFALGCVTMASAQQKVEKAVKTEKAVKKEVKQSEPSCEKACCADKKAEKHGDHAKACAADCKKECCANKAEKHTECKAEKHGDHAKECAADCKKECCAGKEAKTDKKTAAYACPMKCEGDKTYTKEGSCPKCKMDLKPTKTK